MTKPKYKRPTCFICKYELTQNKYRLVNYKNFPRKVCFHCTPAAHKICKKKYTDVKVDCGICTKPVLYNKCVKCDYCNHMIHSTCSYLNKSDVRKIEKDGNFMCFNCTQSIFPFANEHIDHTKTDPSKNQSKKMKEQCFLCTNIVDKKLRHSKHLIVYNGAIERLCLKCSLKRSLPLKNHSLVEYLECTVCQKSVKYEGILCELCRHWSHPDCYDLNSKDLASMNADQSDWFCGKCLEENLPILSFQKESEPKTSKADSFKTHIECSICSKDVKNVQSINCSLCHHWVHAKCIHKFSARSFREFNRTYKNQDWFCPPCLAEALPFIELNNEDFYVTCLEISRNTDLSSSELKTICKQLQNMKMYDQLSFNDNNDSDHHDLFDKHNQLDPDNHFSNTDNCKYIFNMKEVVMKNSTLSVMTYNIRSLRHKFDSLKDQLSILSKELDIICLSETWLKDSDNILDFQLDNYHMPLCFNRGPNKIGGGIIAYFHKKITKYQVNKKLSFNDCDSQTLVIDFTCEGKKHSLVNCYRSPSNCGEKFLSKLDNILDEVKDKRSIVVGDFNFNLLNISTHKLTKDYFDTFTSHSFNTIITKPTRITDRSETIIDHIWTNIDGYSDNNNNKGYIYVTDLSDHLPCIATLDYKTIKHIGYRTVLSRQITDNTLELFRKNIQMKRNALLFHCNNPYINTDEQYNDFFSHFQLIYDESFPLKKRKVHSKTLSKPWITENLQKQIERRNQAFSRRNKNAKAKRKYKTLKDEVDTKLDTSRKDYYRKKLNDQNNSLKTKWTIIKEIINRKKSSNVKLPISSNQLGRHYSTLADKLSSKIPHITNEDIPCSSKCGNRKFHIKNVEDRKFSFRNITQREVYEEIVKLDKNKGPGVDDLDVKALKYVADIISDHLCLLFNSTLDNSIYPLLFKKAKCVPIFKGGELNPLEAVSYRPISILNSLNKVLEKLIHDQIYRFVERVNILPDFQYGYRKQHNTSQAVLDFVQKIKTNIDKKLTSIAVFMDLSKAFDTVNKDILSRKMTELGFDFKSESLIYNYMSNRSFCFQDSIHDTYNLDHGVPQGSVLGPLLFILYTYDVKFICPNDKVIMYADDTTLIVSGRNYIEAAQKTNSILERFVHYFNYNKLSVNPGKTKFICYEAKKKSQNIISKRDSETISVTMNDIVIEEAKTVKFLGVILNKKLTWHDHKLYVQRKVSKCLGILYNSKKVMTEKETIMMYKTFIQSNFLYAIEVWGHTVNHDLDILNKIQNKSLRVLFSTKRTADAWKKSNGEIPSIAELYQRTLKRITTKHSYNQLPQYFTNLCMPKLTTSPKEPKSQTEYNLRSSKNRSNFTYEIISKSTQISKTPFFINCMNQTSKHTQHNTN